MIPHHTGRHTSRRAARALVHLLDCDCPVCTAPRPSDPHPGHAVLNRMATPFALGMATGAAIVAVTGNLGAALRALFGW